jgi:tetratricopeptide (TPR) repeat protein
MATVACVLVTWVNLLQGAGFVSSQGEVPRIVRFYQRYLLDEDTARFIQSTGQYYTWASLCRLLTAQDRITRRAAVMALGFLGGYEANVPLGKALQDTDRGVRVIAETSIQEVWKRYASQADQWRLACVIRLTVAGSYERAIRTATCLIEETPGYAEAWYRRGVAQFHAKRFFAALEDFSRALDLNPYHFLAAAAMGHCQLEMGEPLRALACFRGALKVNPNLESLRARVRYLERALDGRG